MNSIVPWRHRNDFDKYSTRKSKGELFLTCGLLADTVKNLYVLVKENTGPDNAENGSEWYIVLVVYILSLVLEVTGISLSIYLALRSIPPCMLPDGSTLPHTISRESMNKGDPVPDDGEAGADEKSPTKDDKCNSGGCDGKQADGSTLPKCPRSLVVANDVMTVITFVLMVVHAVKGGLHVELTGTN